MLSADRQPDATLLMLAAAEGDQSAAEQLLPLVYDQLRRAAQQRLASERADHTLSATALVHEAYLKLVGPRQVPWAGRGHFYAAAAQAMRRILIDHARSRGRIKRAGGGRHLSLDFRDVAELAVHGESDEIIALDDAIRRLEAQRPRVARVVQFRFYAGLSVDATAEALGVSPRTVELDWAFARAWLYRQLSDEDAAR
jgi:RNA polymerase sigma factor (TIGR02999 family)